MKNGLAATLLGGLAAGALDILYAFLVYGPLAPSLGLPSSSTPVEILQSVAGGWIGREASSGGGMDTALLGLGTHFMIATIMAAAFVFAASRFHALSRNAVLWGLIYGLILFFVMNYVVVPLSAAATGAFATAADAGDRISRAITRALEFKRPLLLAGTVFTHTVLVGLPIALINKRFAGADQQA